MKMPIEIPIAFGEHIEDVPDHVSTISKQLVAFSQEATRDIAESWHTGASNDGSDHGSDHGSVEESEDDIDPHDLEEAAASLRTDTSCLMDLDGLLQNTPSIAERDRSHQVPSATTWTPEMPYSEMIASRFPKASEELASHLGKTSYMRYVRCLNKRQIQTTKIDTGLPESRRFEPESLALGSSIYMKSPAPYAETVMSYHEGDSRPTRVPALPEDAENGTPFACVACGQKVVAKSNSVWKSHLFKDLQPWQCLDMQCGIKSTFASRDDWVAHLSQKHILSHGWTTTECPLCLFQIGPGKHTILEHLEAHLEAISLVALPMDAGDDAEDNAEDAAGPEQNKTNLTPYSSVYLKPESSCRHACPSCANTYSQADRLKEHIYRQHQADETKRWRCEKCDETFSKSIDLNHHVQARHPTVTRCPGKGCDRSFTLQESLSRHVAQCPHVEALADGSSLRLLRHTMAEEVSQKVADEIKKRFGVETTGTSDISMPKEELLAIIQGAIRDAFGSEGVTGRRTGGEEMMPQFSVMSDFKALKSEEVETQKIEDAKASKSKEAEALEMESNTWDTGIDWYTYTYD